MRGSYCRHEWTDCDAILRRAFAREQGRTVLRVCSRCLRMQECERIEDRERIEERERIQDREPSRASRLSAAA